jgi:hypothetical protein
MAGSKVKAFIAEKTRLKMTYIVIALIAVQAILKHFLSGLPFTEAISAEVLVAGWYVQKKSQENTARLAQEEVIRKENVEENRIRRCDSCGTALGSE